MNLQIVILAAGKGLRMNSDIPKVLAKLAGKPLLTHVLETAKNLNPKKIHAIYRDEELLNQEDFQKYDINWIKQPKQLGTGHAVMQALPFIDQASKVLILYGDVPLITLNTLGQLIEDIPEDGLSLLTAKFSDPIGFGRIIRDDKGAITAIVEHKDASPLQLEINEINTGVIATSSKILRNYLPRLNQHNAQGEYYLTDVIELVHNDNLPINGLLALNPDEVLGVNDKKQLAKLERLYQKDIADDFMLRGLTLIDPSRFDLRGNLIIDSDIIIDINVVIEGNVKIGSNTTIGPNTFLKNVKIGNNVTIKANCVIEDSEISDNCIVGPFARIRPGTKLDTGAKIGNFVEVKNTKIGKNSKASHLTYLGDCTIGNDTNIGAGTITCNYDGVNKYQTIIEDLVFVGSNTAIVAPVKIEKGAVIGAGSVIVEDAPAEKLTLARSKQITIENWSRKK